MSRVDDDRDQARIAARLAEQKRVEEQKKTEKAEQSNAFAKLVGKAKEDAQRTQAQQTQQQSSARSAIAHLLEGREGPASDAAMHEARTAGQQQEAGFKAKLGTQALEQKTQQGARADGEAAVHSKLESDQGTQQAQTGRAADSGQAAGRTSARKGDARVSRERAEERKDATDSANAGRSATGAKGQKGDLKADADKGGGQQQGGGKDSKEGAGSPTLRFNPALMAPPPVAKQKDVGGSERLRKIANELAQKIVERVRVGTNAMGKVEFQIDMRSDVLSGLSVKVSSQHGKIRAVFSGSNKDVLKMIEEQGDALKSALSARGLSLEEFKVEART